MPFVSKRQFKWAFSSGQPWARRWARETPNYGGLPATKAEGAAPPNPKGAPAATPTPGRKMTPKERAQHAALVRWGKKNPLAARVAAARLKRKAKAGGAPKDTRTRQEKENQNRAAIAEQTGLGKDLDGAMARLAAGMGGAKDEANADKLVAQGLARKDPTTGRYSLSPEGKRYMTAAKRGDLDGARAAMGAAKDRKANKDKAAQEKAGKEGEKAKAKADKEKAAAAEKEKKKGGGGGGGSKKPDEPEADKDKAKAEARSKAAAETARTVGMKPGDVDELRKAAEAGGARSDALRKLGLVDANGDATDQGRRALGALERGDVRGYRAALQDAQGRMGREQAAQQRKDKSAQDKARREGERTAKDKAKADADAQELRDLADDFKRGRRGLSMQEQRRLAKAGLGAHDDRGKFSVKAWRWTSEGDDAIKQTASDRAMFANMGSSGGGGGGASGGKPTGGTGGLWKRGPSGKRTPQAGLQKPPKKAKKNKKAPARRSFADRKQQNKDGSLNRRERARLEAELAYLRDPYRARSSYYTQRAAEIERTLAGKAIEQSSWRWASDR